MDIYSNDGLYVLIGHILHVMERKVSLYVPGGH